MKEYRIVYTWVGEIEVEAESEADAMDKMYKQLGATRANFRRIMQKYGLSIREPNSEPMFSEAKNFKAEKSSEIATSVIENYL